ncbi:MAG: hypothetical protein REI12_09960 [Pedobacter sp.]|nr:hypothetical protein [Pedobacter sp.]
MRVTTTLLALESAIEKTLVGFFVLLGAGAAPESWQPALQEVRIKQESPDQGHERR